MYLLLTLLTCFQHIVTELQPLEIKLVHYEYEGTYTGADFTLAQVDSPELQKKIDRRIEEISEPAYGGVIIPSNETEFMDMFSGVEDGYVEEHLEWDFYDDKDRERWLAEARGDKYMKRLSSEVYTEVLTNWPSLVCLRAQAHVFTGGAHGDTQRGFVTFNTKTGEFIDAFDAFKPEAVERIFAPVYEKLEGHRKEEFEEFDLDEDEFREAFLSSTELQKALKDHFGIKGNKVVFETGMHDIPFLYNRGDEELEIPYSYTDLKPEYQPPLLVRAFEKDNSENLYKARDLIKEYFDGLKHR